MNSAKPALADDLDLKILNVLRDDARKPFLEVAKGLGVADATVHARVKRMVDDGIIKGFETAIDDARLGYEITAFVEIRVKAGASAEAVSKLTGIHGILEVHEIHGRCDILLKVRVRGLEDLREKLVGEIRAIKEVISSEAYPVLKIAKDEHSLPVKAEG